MAFIDLIVLANARKRSERCVAGLRADGSGWIRLVSSAEHGELSLRQRNLGDAGEPCNLDLIRVEGLCARPVPGQPENWLVRGSWKLLQRPGPQSTREILAKHLSRQQTIFGSESDRIAFASFAQAPAPESLNLVRPRQVVFLHEILGSKRRVRAVFAFGKIRYNLPVTEPSFEERVKCLPAGRHGAEGLGLRDGRYLFALSLGEAFSDGQCYKLVAGVVEIPEDWADFP